MQELIDFIENQEYNFINKEKLESCNKIQNKVKDLIEKEKQQIIDAYETAMETDIYNTPLKTGEQYFNETFKD